MNKWEKASAESCINAVNGVLPKNQEQNLSCLLVSTVEFVKNNK